MLRGSRVILREKRIEDAVKDYAWRTDPELARLDGTSPLTAPFRDFLIGYAQELEHPSPQRHRFAIDNLEGKHIGNCAYYDIDKVKREAELGIVIGDRECWDKGYGTDAVTTLVRHIFQETKLKSIYLHTMDWNIRAQKCFERCGFVAQSRLMRGRDGFIIMEIQRRWLEEREKTPGNT